MNLMETRLRIIMLFTFIYLLFELLMAARQRIKWGRKNKTRGDRMSMMVIAGCYTAGFTLSFNLASSGVGRIEHWKILMVIGGGLVTTGLAFRISSMLTLKQFFTYRVTGLENHELIERGLYKSIRHPAYLGQLMITAGIAVALSNWLSFISLLTPVAAAIIYRIKTEEDFLISQFGESYIDYVKRTSRLIPFIF